MLIRYKTEEGHKFNWVFMFIQLNDLALHEFLYIVAQWIEHPPSVQEVMGLISVGDSYFFFVPHLCHVH